MSGILSERRKRAIVYSCQRAASILGDNWKNLVPFALTSDEAESLTQEYMEDQINSFKPYHEWLIDRVVTEELMRLDPENDSFTLPGQQETSEQRQYLPDWFRASVKEKVDDLMHLAHKNALEKGWWDIPERSVGESIAMIHEELSEALQIWRRGWPLREVRIEEGKPEGFGIELADVIIRILDLCGAHEVNLGACIVQKMLYNRTRPYRHGKIA